MLYVGICEWFVTSQNGIFLFGNVVIISSLSGENDAAVTIWSAALIESRTTFIVYTLCAVLFWGD